MTYVEKKLESADLHYFKSNVENSLSLVRHYAQQYKGKEHYEHLGSSCVMSATNTIDTIINSAHYLDGQFLMADEIDVEHVVNWFMKNKKYECDPSILMFYIAHYLKRKINILYRSIRRDEFIASLTILGSKSSHREFKKQWNKRKKAGIWPIR